ncbi:MAG TPA: FAD-linked oxidase C-terminal domain-containing protein [Gemmataceae bacterium]|nr:FAD-linked oxidase C-terminal domain-containing protein [Gemmataceae bacterium]
MTDFTELRRDSLARHLRKHLAGEVRFDVASRRLYSTDASIYQIEPLGVVFPKSTEDIVAAVQIAAEMHVPITPRGGGTSLSGQSIGPGVVLDCSKYLNSILAVDPIGRTARVQPGVVLDQFNRALAPHNLLFGPEVSTSSRANLGGMMGNNSAGARSIVYGKTIDHVRRLDVILGDGSRASFGAVSPDEWDRRAELSSLEGRAYRQVREIVRRNRAEILRRFPRILRRVSGYNLDVLADSPLTPDPSPLSTGARGAIPPPSPPSTGARGAIPPPSPPLRGRGVGGEGVGLHQLLVGSEGTLAVVTEAELGLLPRPKTRGLLVPQFASLAAAMDAVAACLEMKPSAVELMDHYLLELTAGNLALRETMKAIVGKPQAVLMVEFSGDDEREIADRVERLRKRLEGVAGLTAAVPALDPALRDPLWDLRKAGMPLLYGMRGDRKPVTFVEDCAVSPERMPEFVRRFRETLHRHGTDGAFYGHASVGCLHIRPLLNLKDPNDVTRMRRITADVTDLVLEYNGSLSGEHGDGLARSEWNEKMFGPIVYQAFREVKAVFDPEGLLNPGKIVDAPRMTDNLRYGPGYRPIELPTVFNYDKQEGFIRSVEMCNGNGACRKMQGGTMCPSFRATRDERDSTRGRANALRLAMSGEQPLQQLKSKWVQEVFDLCLMCKACKAECPSNVDVAKLKAEWLELLYQDRPRPLGHMLAAHLPSVNRLGAPFAPLVNWLQSGRAVRWLLEKTAGVDRRRSLPPLHANHFRRWFAHHKPDAAAGRTGRVLLLDDCFTTFNEPAIGKAAVHVLERAGYAVELANLRCCGRPMLSKGFLSETRALVREQAPALARRIADGTPILGLEPSCILTLADEWTELAPGPETQRIAAAAHLADGWLAKQVGNGACELSLLPRAEKCVLHGHCHQKALVGAGGSAAALRLAPGMDVTVLDAGCCGMAGSFGYEKEHYDLSVKIAGLALLPALAAAPESTVVAPGTSCRHQIKDLAGRRALHPLEVLEQRLPT